MTDNGTIIIVNEKTNMVAPSKFKAKYKGATKTYKCPYCDMRFNRYDLVFHIDDAHEELIPKDYTAGRIVFNYVNNKEHGRCIICKNITKWNEEVWKYERLCDMKECREKYVAMTKGRMVNKYGKEHLLNDPDHQNKMLNNRSISGSYKFQDGGVRTYVGSYEKKLLEFYDKIMNVKSKDIMTPGPTVEYTYDGKKHFWITDLYYIPANLAHDAKDGGDNPNKRQMDEYRAKQDAKEKAIRDQGKYNYIRLTDNNFGQLFYILAEIKQQLMGIDDERRKGDTVIEINEATLDEYMNVAATGGLPTQYSESEDDDDVYIVNTSMQNIFNVDSAIATGKDESCLSLFKCDENGELKRINPDELIGESISIFKYVGDRTNRDIAKSLQEGFKNGTFKSDKDYFYKAVSNTDSLSEDQILFDNNFKEIIPLSVVDNFMIECESASLKLDMNKVLGKDFSMTCFTNEEKIEVNNLLGENVDIQVLQDQDGYYLYDPVTEMCTVRSSRILDIPKWQTSKLKMFRRHHHFHKQ